MKTKYWEVNADASFFKIKHGRSSDILINYTLVYISKQISPYKVELTHIDGTPCTMGYGTNTWSEDHLGSTFLPSHKAFNDKLEDLLK